MITTKKGDLIFLAQKGKFDAIVHGCNCFCVMGAGIAKTIKNIWPQVYQVDKKTKRGDKSKLGTYSRCDIILTLPDKNSYKIKDFSVLNAYTQYNYKWSGDPPVDLEAIERVFTQINKDFKGKEIGIPMIGAGLAGGNWEEIYEIIKSVTLDVNITVVEWNRG